VLEMINFPFIMSFIRTFKDNFSVYFLVEYIKGMELFDVIREIGLLTMSDTQFYIGSMILALEYLHSKQVVYRDIKPENIMIDYKGTKPAINVKGTCISSTWARPNRSPRLRTTALSR
jgi:cGMP-dependent protein kinase